MPKSRTYTYDMITDKMKSKLLSLYQIDPQTQCWNWQGVIGKVGYGYLSGPTRDQMNLVAHRLSWMLHNQQDWPKDLETRHTCHNRRCINPDHLVPGTRQENMNDMRARGHTRLKLNNTRLVTPAGIFDSVPAAAKANHCCCQMFYRRLKNLPDQYYKIKI